MGIKNMLYLHYHIRTKNIEQITNRVYRIWDGQHEYALKKSSLNHENIAKWQHVLKQANEHNLPFILPVYLTLDQQLTVTYDGHVYYLSPWLNSTDELAFKQMYQHLGQLHHKTKLIRTIQVNNFIEKFADFKNVCMESKEQFLTYIENFEQKRYMSPFELQVCTHFHVVEPCFNHLIQLIEHFIDHQEETMQWSQSVCHGNLTFSHLLSANGCRMINWEKATYDNATTDLIHLFQTEITYYDAPINEFLENFSTYLEENPLTKEEICILIIYLLNPLPYLQQIDYHMQDSFDQPMIQHVQTMEFLYRQLQFALKMYELLESDLVYD